MDINALIVEHVRPLQRRIEKLEAEVARLRAQTERAGQADAMPRGVSANPPGYDGQVKYLTDKGYAAYADGGAWKKFSDDSAVT